jgi:hypothetical protein
MSGGGEDATAVLGRRRASWPTAWNAKSDAWIEDARRGGARFESGLLLPLRSNGGGTGNSSGKTVQWLGHDAGMGWGRRDLLCL